LALHDHIVKATRCDGVHVMVYANACGRSHALPFTERGDARDHFLEGCVLYRRWEDGDDYLWPPVIAHELLHVYGAWDLYPDAPSVRPPQAHMAGRLFANDVMRVSRRDIRGLQVGALTAWRIGWAPEKEWFEGFRPDVG
jgi:hypothetical protein